MLRDTFRQAEGLCRAETWELLGEAIALNCTGPCSRPRGRQVRLLQPQTSAFHQQADDSRARILQCQVVPVLSTLR